MAGERRWGWEETGCPPEQLRRCETAQEEDSSSPPVHPTHQWGREAGRERDREYGDHSSIMIT